MHVNVDFVVEIEMDPAWESLLREAVVAAVGVSDYAGTASLTLLLSDDARLQALNLAFMGYDKPTDVLSFPSGEWLTSPVVNLGDIAISVPQARRQAAQAGHTVAAELQLLVVHGVLHLLGHDHAEPAQKDAMWRLQAAALARLGTAVALPP
ncbi:MAG: rRNA maturation RNase YbeY [Anaerolineales bacterium]|nr:rRNA maturation RNase YbeY [Anaerolineales bacterium]MCB8953677.1 rRNA maturation RNase YbeY [Ardenticatenales bacterium]